MKCPYCGQELSDNARFCRFCGRRLEPPPVPQPQPQPPQPEKRPEPAPAPRRQPSAGNGSKAGPGQKKLVWAAVAVLVLLAAVIAGVLILSGGKKEAGGPSAPSAGTVYQEDRTASSPEQSVTSEPEVSRQETPASSPAASEAEPVWGQQEILVTPSGSGTAVLTLRQKYGSEWETLYTCTAAIGRNGTTTAPQEGDGKTPAGTFPVEFCYGLEQPETGIPFVQLGPDSIWVDDGNSPYYNCLTTQGQAGDVSHEDTYSQFTRGFYTINIFFANNGDGRTPGSATPGAGSVRVLEGYAKALEPTNGDIKITAEDMDQLLQRLDADYDPVVTVMSES